MISLHENDPSSPGMYVAYVNDSIGKPVSAKRVLLMWDSGWFYPMSDQRFRGPVYQSIGPLPVLHLFD